MNSSTTSDEAHASVELALDILCGFCTALFDENTSWVEHEYRRHHDIEALTQSAETGCHICSLIISQVPAEDVACLQRELEMTCARTIGRIGINLRGSSTITLLVAAFNSSVQRKGWDTCVGPWTALARLHVRLREDDYTQESRSSSSLSFSESSIAQVSQWIEDCQSVHSQCREVQAVAATRKILPTRLLDLASALEDGQIKLCSSQSVGPSIRYSTLSHCWGGDCAEKLTVDNLDSFQQSIRVDSLPKTFKDAVSVTRQLGLYYLWIDALCIVQDSTNDWRREAAAMGDVYANSYITLAASTSPNSAGGLIHKRTSRSVWPCRLVAKWKCFPAGEQVISIPDWAGEQDLAPLSTRAWVYQEFLLSKRFLYFGKDQVRWQCYCLTASEVYPDYSSWDDSEDDTNGIPAKSTILRLTRNPQQAAETWIRLCEAYSQKALTQPTDRLLALTGIARMAHVLLGSAENEYLAGLWRSRLLEELLWQRDSGVVTSSNPTTAYIAPTWSWASIQYALYPFPQGDRAQEIIWNIGVIDAAVNAVNDVFGSVTHGTLLLECSLSYITTILQRSSKSEPEAAKDQWIISAINSISMNYECNLRLDNPAHPASSSGTHTFCFMPIRASFCSNPALNTMAGLLLQQTGQSRGQYYRIGLLNVFSGRQQQELISNLERGSTPNETCYLETASRADRTIEVI